MWPNITSIYLYGNFCLAFHLRTWRTRCSPSSNPRVQQHTDSLSCEPAHVGVRASLLLLFFHGGWWGQWDEYQPLNTHLSTYDTCSCRLSNKDLFVVVLFVNKAPSFVWKHSFSLSLSCSVTLYDELCVSEKLFKCH